MSSEKIYRIGKVVEAPGISHVEHVIPEDFDWYLGWDFYREAVEAEFAAQGPKLPPVPEFADIPEKLAAKHTLMVGATGGGKSYTYYQYLFLQMKMGHSVVIIDPKRDNIQVLLHLARKAGVPPERITLFADGQPIPGWNILDCGLDPTTVADAFCKILKSVVENWGERLEDILKNAIIVLSSHKLAVFELIPFLMREEYMRALLALPLSFDEHRDKHAYKIAKEFFEQEFLPNSKAARLSEVGSVTRRVRELKSNWYMNALFSSRETTMDLSKLWKQQTVVLVHLDNGKMLGDTGATIVGAFFTNYLQQTARQGVGTHPVVLAIDEFGVQAKYIGEPLGEVLNLSRGLSLRLILCCQTIAQIPPALRNALVGNAHVQMYFNLDGGEASEVAGRLRYFVGGSTKLESVTLTLELTKYNYLAWPLYSADGHPVSVYFPGDWDKTHEIGCFAAPTGSSFNTEDHDSLIQRLAQCGIQVKAPLMIYPRPLPRYPSGFRKFLRQGCTDYPPPNYSLVPAAPLFEGIRAILFWDGSYHPQVCAQIDWPDGEIVRTSKPMPDSTIVSALTKSIVKLPERHCLLYLRGQQPYVVRIYDFNLFGYPHREQEAEREAAWQKDCAWVHSDSKHFGPEEIEAMIDWREQRIQQTIDGTLPKPAQPQGTPTIASDEFFPDA